MSEGKKLRVFEGALEKLHDEKNSYYIMFKGYKILCDKKKANSFAEIENGFAETKKTVYSDIH